MVWVQLPKSGIRFFLRGRPTAAHLKVVPDMEVAPDLDLEPVVEHVVEPLPLKPAAVRKPGKTKKDDGLRDDRATGELSRGERA